MSLVRTRWAAVGAAVAITMGAGGVGLVTATTPTNAVAFVPIEPCRVLDLRPGTDNIGPRATPLGANETYTIDVISNTNNAGDCAGIIPGTATAVSMNVTTLNATAPTFLTIWDGSNPRPVASSLNPAPGQPPTPNAVTTNLNTNGEFSIYNLTGTVNVLADINGYYTDHHHDDRYYTKTQSNDRFTTQTANDDRYYTKTEADDRFLDDGSGTEAAWTYENSASGNGIAAEVTVDTREIGFVIVNATAQAQVLTGPASQDGQIVCSITDGTEFDNEHLMLSPLLEPGDGQVLSGTRAFTIAGIPLAGERTYRLVCEENPTGAELIDIHLNATFVPDDDARPFRGG